MKENDLINAIDSMECDPERIIDTKNYKNKRAGKIRTLYSAVAVMLAVVIFFGGIFLLMKIVFTEKI